MYYMLQVSSTSSVQLKKTSEFRFLYLQIACIYYQFKNQQTSHAINLEIMIFIFVTQPQKTILLNIFLDIQKYKDINSKILIIMKDQEAENGNQILLDDSHSISALWKKLKNSIFDVLFVLLDNSEEGETMIGLSLETGIDYLQMMAFPFDNAVIAVWSSGETIESIRQIVGLVNVSSYIPGVGFDTFLILLYALIFLIITVILDIIYVAYSFSKKKFRFTWPLVYLAKIVPLIVTVMFLPIMQTLLEVVKCETGQGNDYQSMATFPEIKCWEGWHLVHSGITLLFSSIFVFISCLVTLTVFEPRMTTNRLTSRQNSSGQVIFIINKIICQFVFSFSPFSSSLPYTLMLFLLSGWLYSAYNIKQPYYSKQANKFFRIISTYYFWTNLMLLVSQLLKPLNFQHGLVIWLCGIAFIGVTIIFERKSNIDTLFSSSLKFKSGEELQNHLQYVLQLHHNRNDDNNSYMLLLGYIEKHIQICLEDDCPLRIKKNGFSEDNEENVNGKEQQEFSCKMLLKQIQRMFKFGVKKYPDCTKLRLTFAFFYMQKLKNKKKAFQQFTKAINSDPSFGEQFIIYRFRKIITQKLQENQEQNQTDLIDLIRFDNYISLCEEGMVRSGKLHKQFWIELLEQSPNLIRLNVIGGKITQTFNTIEKNYEQVFKITNDHSTLCELQYNYSLYLLFVTQDIKTGKIFLKQAQKNYRTKRAKVFNIQSTKSLNSNSNDMIFEESNSEEALFIDDQKRKCDNIQIMQEKGVIVVKGGEQTNNVCRILKSNRPFQDIVKYTEKQLFNSKLDKILPNLYSSVHDQTVSNWINKPKRKKTKINEDKKSKRQLDKNYFNEIHYGYVRDSSNLIRKVNYKVRFLAVQRCFVAEFQIELNKNKQAVILCDPFGSIIDYSYEFIFRFPYAINQLSIDGFLPEKVLKNFGNETSMNQNQSVMLKDYKGTQKQHYCDISSVKLFLDQKYKYGLKTQSAEQSSKIEKNISSHRLEDGSTFIGMSLKITENMHEINLGIIKQKAKTQTGKNLKEKQGFAFLQISKRIQKFNQSLETKSHAQIFQNFFGFLTHKGDLPLKDEKNVEKNYSEYTDQNGNICQIKAFRYFNNNFKRIYYDDLLEDESDYDYEQKNTDIQAKLSQQKMNNYLYQQRIKKAINTFIYHPQILVMFYLGIVMMAVFVAANIFAFQQFNEEVTNFQLKYIQNLNKTVETTFTISERLLDILFYDSSLTTVQQLKSSFDKESQVLNYQYFIDEHQVNNFKLEDNTLVTMDIQNCLLRIQGNILRYVSLLKNHNNQGTISPHEIQISYHNFLIVLFQKLQQNFKEGHIQRILSILFIICLVTCYLFSIAFLIGWIYNSLKIRQKTFEILIWFLDIPADYLNFAYKKCLYFNKNYEESRKLIEKQVQIDRREHYIEQFITKNQSPQNISLQRDGQTKFRQILISRYRKEGLLQKFECKQFHKLYIVIGVNLYILCLLFFHDYFNKQIDLLSHSQNFYAKQLLWTENLIMTTKIQQLKQINQDQWPIFSDQDLLTLSSEIRSKFYKITKEKQGGIFIQIANKLNSRQDALTKMFIKFQYENLCINQQPPKLQQCQKMLKYILISGYSLVKQELQDFTIDKKSEEDLLQLYYADKNYISKQMKRMLQKWSETIRNQITQSRNMLEIFLYIYLVIGICLFLIGWNLYLRSVNLQLNQTIRILNMIPMHLLPVSRKEIRSFLKWVILQAGEQGEQDDEEEYKEKLKNQLESENFQSQMF